MNWMDWTVLYCTVILQLKEQNKKKKMFAVASIGWWVGIGIRHRCQIELSHRYVNNLFNSFFLKGLALSDIIFYPQMHLIHMREGSFSRRSQMQADQKKVWRMSEC